MGKYCRFHPCMHTKRCTCCKAGSEREITDHIACMHAVQSRKEGGARLDELHDDVDVVVGLDDLVQADDVRVHEQAQDFYLAPHCSAHACSRVSSADTACCPHAMNVLGS